MTDPIPPLERTVGQLLVLRGFVTATGLGELWERAQTRGARHGGSLLAGAALAEGLLSRVAADALFRGVPGPESRPSSSGMDATFAAGLPRVGAGTGPTVWESPEPPKESQAAPTYWEGPLQAPVARVEAGATSWEQDPVATPGAAAETIGGRGDTVRAGDTQLQGGDTIRAEAPRAVRKGRVGADPAVPPTAAALLAQLLEGERYQLTPGGTPGHLSALDRRLRREVVVRVPFSPVAGPADAERFLREAQLQAKLDHPAIPRVHDLGQRDGQPFFVTDPLPGKRLVEHPGAGNPRRLPALLRAFLRVAAALEHAHAMGLVHGELGPEHVVLGSLGEAWVDGWGRASALASAPGEVQAAARAPLPPAPGGLPARHLAPEARAGRPLDERADVWGLGVLLLWILVRRLPGAGRRGVDDELRAARKKGLPHELVAIAGCALASGREERYLGAGALIEDVRAWLDGKPVAAAPESLLLTLRRQARRHPVPAAIASAGTLALALLVAVTLSLVHRSLRRAQVSADQAQAALARAEQLGRLAELRLEAARLRSAGEEGLAHAGAEAGGDPAVQARFTAAEAQAKRAEAKAGEAAALARQLAEPAEEAASDLGARARRLRGEWVLRAAADPPPLLAGALADWKALVARDPADATAQLGRFEAARRLPGEEAEAEAQDALASLRELDGPLADLARAHALVLEAEDLAVHGRPAAGPVDQASALSQAALAGRPDLALGWELRGRAALARVGRGHQSQKSGSVEGPLVDLIHAVRVDPRDPFARLAVLEHWNESYGWHQPWRYEAHLFGAELRAAARVTERLEPAVEQAAYLQLTGLAEASLPGIERTLARLPERPSEAERWQLVRLRVLHARALLAAGGDAGAAVAALPPPEELPPVLASEVLVLRAHHLIVTSGGEAATEALGLAARTPARSILAHQDLLRAITDPRGDARAVFSVVSRLELPRPGSREAQAMLPFAAAWFHAGARVGAPLGALVMVRDWLALMGAFGPGNVDPAIDPARLAFARVLLEHDPRAAEAGVMPLLVWASANHVLSGGTRAAAEARQLLLERARRLGMEELRREWESLPEGEEPAREVWVPRAWEEAR